LKILPKIKNIIKEGVNIILTANKKLIINWISFIRIEKEGNGEKERCLGNTKETDAIRNCSEAR
jgi:hypothetical protein